MSDSQASTPGEEVAPDEVVEATAESAETSEEPIDEQDELASLRAELEAANDRLLRSQAELDNFRKRTRRDMEEERRYAGLPLLRDLLTVVDNLQRAIDAAEQDENNAGLLEGVRMVATQLTGVLEQHNCKPIEAVGAAFDPNLHEAIGHEPTDEHPANTVARDLQTGYALHDRVIRPSQVFIAAPPPEPTADGE